MTKKKIDTKLPSFGTFIVDMPEEFKNKWGEKIRAITKYNKKDNGELMSSLLALYKSRELERKVDFYTDDMPATEDFKDFFMYNQVGSICNTVGLLIYLYWKNKNFSNALLKTFLSNLKGQYGSVYKNYKEIIKKNKDRWTNKHLKNKQFKITLSSLEKAVSTFDQEELSEIIEQIKTSYKDVYNDLSKGGEIRNCSIINLIKNVEDTFLENPNIYKTC